MMSRKRILLVIVLTLVSAALLLTESGMFRTVASFPLLFVLPGYAVLAAWFPQRLTSLPGGTLLVLGLSLALATLGGFILNRTPWGLQTVTWVVWLAGITLVNSLFALRRTYEPVPVNEDRFVGLRAGQTLLVGAAILITFGAVWVARLGVELQPRTPFTQLWMISTDSPDTVRVGIRNEEGHTVTYQLIIVQDIPVVQSELTLAAGESWEGLFSYLPDNTSDLVAELYRSDDPTALYRSVSLALNAPEAD